MRLRGLLLVLALSGCAPPPQLPAATATPVPGDVVVVASSGGRLPTKPAPRTPVPTPTTDLAVLIRTVRPFPTRSPGPPDTPTPTVVPAYTTTPRPTATRPSSSFPVAPFLLSPTVGPTRTPPPRGSPIERPELTKEPTEEPYDPHEPNDAQGQATALSATPLDAAINRPTDVDVYKVAVDQTDVVLSVTLSGQQPGRYKVDVIAPRSGKVGRQRLDGTVTVRALADVGTETGTYYVFVQRAGNETPQGTYVISADFTAPVATPTVVDG